jgi:hypothetical protein
MAQVTFHLFGLDMTDIHYTHANNLHSLNGANAGMAFLRSAYNFDSLLDVGAGTGTWLKAALGQGVSSVYGVDGVPVGGRQFHVDRSLIEQRDLRTPFDLGRRFDAALCLEVAEHLPEASSAILVESICRHSDLIFFSAAIPGQRGDHHINCQWPAFWQALFNSNGFACTDELRPRIWDNEAIEPWYRQNLFVARRNFELAGSEPRIAGMGHPLMLQHVPVLEENFRAYVNGERAPKTYAKALVKSVYRRIFRR